MTEDRMSLETAPQSAKSGGRSDRIARWLLIAIGIYSGLLVALLNVFILSSGKVENRAILLMADGMILFWIVAGGSLTPLLRKRLVPRLVEGQPGSAQSLVPNGMQAGGVAKCRASIIFLTL